MASTKEFRKKIIFASDTIADDATIEEATSYLRRAKSRSLVVLDSNKSRFVGLLSDGDVRRFLLAQGDLKNPVRAAMNTEPTVIKQDGQCHLSEGTIQKIGEHCFLIPILDENQRVISVLERARSNDEKLKDVTLFIMAGGRGTRLMPLTSSCPKPMLRVDGRPILEHSILSAQRQGIQKIVISLGYLGEQIREYFGDGRTFGLQIEYVEETRPLGTAGALSLYKNELLTDVIVMNGDVLSDCDFQSLLGFHRAFKASATMGVKRQSFSNPFGVVNVEGVEISSFEEKPTLTYQINAGIYMVQSEDLKKIRGNERKDMPDFLMQLKRSHQKVIAFPLFENWTDIGTPQDLAAASRRDEF